MSIRAMYRCDQCPHTGDGLVTTDLEGRMFLEEMPEGWGVLPDHGGEICVDCRLQEHLAGIQRCQRCGKVAEPGQVYPVKLIGHATVMWCEECMAEDDAAQKEQSAKDIRRTERKGRT